MKKVSLFLCTSFLALAGTAQTDPDASRFLPQDKDWGLGLSATPVLNYIGNMFNGTANNAAPTITGASTPFNNVLNPGLTNSIFGKYVASQDRYFRGRFAAGVNTMQTIHSVQKDNQPIQPNKEYVEDVVSITTTAALIALGVEYRRGPGRLQGYYGYEAIAGYGSMNTKTDFGNAFSDTNLTPGTHLGTFDVRVIETRSNSTLLVGARGFVGIEYFFLPRISVSGELGYSVGFTTNFRGYTRSESWNTGEGKVMTFDTPQQNRTIAFGLGLDAINAGINLGFYF